MQQAFLTAHPRPITFEPSAGLKARPTVTDDTHATFRKVSATVVILVEQVIERRLEVGPSPMIATTFTCKCCDQAWPGPDVPEFALPWLLLPKEPELCVMCEGHQGNVLKMESEHAGEFKQRLAEAHKQSIAHVVERGEFKRRILNLERDLDKALDALNRATLFHRRLTPGKDCMCGGPHCATCLVGADPWVYEHIQELKARKARGAA